MNYFESVGHRFAQAWQCLSSTTQEIQDDEDRLEGSIRKYALDLQKHRRRSSQLLPMEQEEELYHFRQW